MRKNEHTAYEAALLYYFQGETMEAIARRLGVSRSTVSRLLSEARETGVVKISLQDPGTTPESLSSDLGHEFGVRVHLVSVRESDTEVRRLDLVARVAARLVASWMEPGTVLGIAWGTTIAAVTQHLTPHPCPESAVVQLNGAANANTSGVNHAGAIVAAAATAFDASMHHFPVPAFFDYTTTKEAMWRERSIRRVLALQRRADMALFGVGSLAGGLASHVYAAGYLDDEDMETLRREKVVGDVCTVMLRADGSYADIPLNERTTGPRPHELKLVRRRVCVVAGESKVPALRAALRAGTITDLIIDEDTAGQLRQHHP
ncbi:sugar-binding transcriptional regulator [Saccharopolyspora cebuensis]|uniref:Sugar-binding transcriptional regulator n=1 Tax=Saccharopolyspora cebuensis TaxID=418759 RepID=A0ABV4CHE4_9PSEU